MKRVRSVRSCILIGAAVAVCAGGPTYGAAPAQDIPAPGHGAALPISPRNADRGTSAAPAKTRSIALPVVGLVFVSMGLAYGLLRRFAPGLMPRPTRQVFEIVGQSRLGSQGAVYLVRCGPRVLVIGATTSQLTTLAEFADPEEIDAVLNTSGQSGNAEVEVGLARSGHMSS